MKRSKRKGIMKTAAITAAITAAALSGISAYAAGWINTESGGSRWIYMDENGQQLKDCWRWIDGNGDGTAECYCFDANGIMLANTVTPDGYTVNENGAWTDSSGAVQTKNYPLTGAGDITNVNVGVSGGYETGSHGTVEFSENGGGSSGVSVDDTERISENIEAGYLGKYAMDRNGSCRAWYNVCITADGKLGLETHSVRGDSDHYIYIDKYSNNEWRDVDGNLSYVYRLEDDGQTLVTLHYINDAKNAGIELGLTRYPKTYAVRIEFDPQTGEGTLYYE